MTELYKPHNSEFKVMKHTEEFGVWKTLKKTEHISEAQEYAEDYQEKNQKAELEIIRVRKANY